MPPPREVQCPQCGCLVPIPPLETLSYDIAETRAKVDQATATTLTQSPRLDPIPLQETPPLLPTTATAAQPSNFAHSSSDFLSVVPNYSLTTPDQPLPAPTLPGNISDSQPGPAYDVALPPGHEPDDALAAPTDNLNPARFDATRRSSKSSIQDSFGFDNSDDDPHPRRSWGWLLLASYASALTIACAWLLWQVKHPRVQQAVTTAAPTIAQDSRPDLGARGDRSQLLPPLAPIPPERVTELGQPLRIGSLELTPRQVTIGKVALERTTLEGTRSSRDGGANAVILKLTLKNLSNDIIFAPLDEGYLREPDRGLPLSFIQDVNSSDRIYFYPLPIASEWNIVGQRFRDLKPGEQFDSLIISDRDAASRLPQHTLWRLRIRTGPAALDTTVVGIQVNREEIQKVK